MFRIERNKPASAVVSRIIQNTPTTNTTTSTTATPCTHIIYTFSNCFACLVCGHQSGDTLAFPPAEVTNIYGGALTGENLAASSPDKCLQTIKLNNGSSHVSAHYTDRDRSRLPRNKKHPLPPMPFVHHRDNFTPDRLKPMVTMIRWAKPINHRKVPPTDKKLINLSFYAVVHLQS